MAITLDAATRVFSIPQADLTLITGTLFEADTNALRKEMMALLASEPYAYLPDPFDHAVEPTTAGVTYFRTLTTLAGFSYTFTPDSQFTVRLAGSNNDFFDVEGGRLNQNQVQVIPGNSAGLQTVATGGLTAAQDALITETHGQTRRELHLDEESVTNGAKGFQQDPFNNWTSTIDYGEAVNIHHIVVVNDTNIDRQVKNFEITGLNIPTIDTSGEIVDRCTFREVVLTGEWIGELFGDRIRFDDAAGSANILNSTLSGTFSLPDSAITVLSKSSTLIGGVIIDFLENGVAGSTFLTHALEGNIIIRNMDHEDDMCILGISRGTIIIESSCTLGFLSICGSAALTNNANGTIVDLVSKDDEIFFNHITEDSETFKEAARLMRANAAGVVAQLGDNSYKIKSKDGSIDRIEGQLATNGGRDIIATDSG